jgi:hypothetical protein
VARLEARRDAEPERQRRRRLVQAQARWLDGEDVSAEELGIEPGEAREGSDPLPSSSRASACDGALGVLRPR